MSLSNKFFIGVFCILISSCVSTRRFNEISKKSKHCEDENSSLKQENLNLTAKSNEQSVAILGLQKRADELTRQIGTLQDSLKDISDKYSDVQSKITFLNSENQKLSAGKSEEAKKLIAQLQITQEDLLEKEDRLKKLAKDLSDKEKSLKDLDSKLGLREQKVKDLQHILERKDSAVYALKNAVAEALLGFQDNGLTIEQRNGKVYVSMEEQLLFQSGSIEIDKKGEDALKQLAKVLEKHPDINIMIEGHTDNVPIAGGPIKDNWDLSVLRATSIVKIISLHSKIDPKRLSAAGRGPYLPIDVSNTPKARKKNRRTEIILTPKLDELLKALETN